MRPRCRSCDGRFTLPNSPCPVETFNTLNRFNSNTGLTYNYTTGAPTPANSVTITSAQVQARQTVMSLRFRSQRVGRLAGQARNLAAALH
jgi:hypothetical protein